MTPQQDSARKDVPADRFLHLKLTSIAKKSQKIRVQSPRSFLQKDIILKFDLKNGFNKKPVDHLELAFSSDEKKPNSFLSLDLGPPDSCRTHQTIDKETIDEQPAKDSLLSAPKLPFTIFEQAIEQIPIDVAYVEEAIKIGEYSKISEKMSRTRAIQAIIISVVCRKEEEEKGQPDINIPSDDTQVDPTISEEEDIMIIAKVIYPDLTGVDLKKCYQKSLESLKYIVRFIHRHMSINKR